MDLFIDGNYKRLAYLDFLSAFGQEAEENRDFPPSSPGAAHLLESLDNLSPRAALARVQTLVTASANNLHKVTLPATHFLPPTVKVFLCQLITFSPLSLSFRHSLRLTRREQGWSKPWIFDGCSTAFAAACQTNSTDSCWPNWSWTVRAARSTGGTSWTSFNHRTPVWKRYFPEMLKKVK